MSGGVSVPDRFAAIADIHGNRWALEAVLADIECRGIRTVVNLGDHLFGPLDPDGTAALLMRHQFVSIRGNQDRELLEPGCTQTVTPDQAAWLADMPSRAELPGILLFHGTPHSDAEYLPETVGPAGVRFATDPEIRSRLGEEDLPGLLLCGHTHIPRVVRTGAQLIVNPGSVGLQAYADDQPWPHVMETGSPHARYAIVERSETGWYVEQIQLRYAWEAASRQAKANGRDDWAWRLATGRAR